MTTPTQNESATNEEVLSPNQKASEHSYEFGRDGAIDQARRDLVKRPAYVMASQEAFDGYLQKFDPYLKVEDYRGSNLEYPDGVFVAVFTTKEADGSEGVSKTFLLHELEENACIVGDIVKKMKPFTRAIDREMVNNMIACAVEMRKRGDYKTVEEDELNFLLEDALNRKSAVKAFRELEETIIEELENYTSISNKEYDKATHHGIFLDTPELKRKFGDHAVGVSKYTLMELFTGEPEQSRAEYSSRGTDAQLKKYLYGWKDMGLLIKKSEHGRLNEMIKNLNENGDRERFYIVKCPKVYEALTELSQKEGGAEIA